MRAGSRNTYERFVEASPVPMWIQGLERIRFANEPAIEFFGCESMADLRGRSVLSFVHEDERERVRQRNRELLETGRPLEPVEGQIWTTGGERRVGQFAAFPIQYLGDDAILVTARDVTDRHTYRRELERQNERLEAIFRNTPAATVEYVFEDGQPVVETINGAFEETFGCEAPEVTGRPLGEVVVPPEGSDDGAKPEFETSEMGERHFSEEVERQTVDGPRTFLLQNAPVELEEETRGYASYVDVTDRRERERQIERYREMLDGVGDVAFTVDAEGRYEIVSEQLAAAHDVSPQELEGRESLLARWMRNSGKWDQFQELVAGEREDVRLEMDIELAGYGEAVADMRLTRHTVDGEFDSVVVVGRDISDRKRRQEAVKALHEVATTIQAQETVEDVCQRTVAAATDVLDFALCTIVLREGEWLVPYASSTEMPRDDSRPMRLDQGLAGKTYQTGRVQTVDEITDEDETDPAWGDYQSGISVPVGDHGVFQAVSTEPRAFDARDVEFAELLVSHAASAIDRIEREQELRKYEGIVETTRDTAAVLDEERRFEVVNSRLAEIYGSTPERLRGERSRLLDVIAEQHDGPDPYEELVAGEREEFRTELELDYPEHGRRVTDIRMTRLTDDGEFAGVVAVGRDVSDRKERERELRIYEAIVEAIDEGVYVVDEDRHIEFVNGSYLEMKGTDRSDILGTSITEWGDDEIIDQIIEQVEELRRGERDVVKADYDLRSVDGEYTPVELRITPLSMPNGERGRVGIIRDISERKRYEQRLEEQTEQLEMLNRIIRHDISNDMNIAIEMTKIVRDRLEDQELESHLDHVLEATRHTVELTRTARDLMQTMGAEDSEREPIPLSEVLDEEVDEVDASYEDATVEVDGTLPAVDVLADDLLSSVFRNLLKNAVQHNDADDPEVVVSAEAADEHATVRVADNGPGIPDDRKEAIFGKGERGLDSEGTGIGLYLVQSLVDSYEGSVHVEDRDGGGSVFVVELETADGLSGRG